ncbi:hypothetical protein MN116_003566 [Schistosoma mekongi]|uniref:Uncharacterized protein n=1 Tax=Schistosoma mekongi TaxID=38744 RepID=A0AAE2D6V8_SCHME|nr:hypothetical protein MN116_003566 [Schistosoma mekongi]
MDKSFPSKTKTTNSNSKSIRVSKMSREKGITHTNKAAKNSQNGQENARPKTIYSNDKNNNSSTIYTKENKPYCAPTITELSNYYSDEFFKHKKELNNRGKPGKHKHLDVPKCKDFERIPNETTITTKPHIIPITEVFDKKYFQDFPYM